MNEQRRRQPRHSALNNNSSTKHPQHQQADDSSSSASFPTGSEIPKGSQSKLSTSYYKINGRRWNQKNVFVLAVFALMFFSPLLWAIWAFVSSTTTTTTTTATIVDSISGATLRKVSESKAGVSSSEETKKNHAPPEVNRENTKIDDAPRAVDLVVNVEAAQPVYGTYVLWDDPAKPTKKIEAVYAVPDPSTTSELKGVILLLHACTHSAMKFFSHHPTKCPLCVGLSEEIRITRLCLKRGYAVLAVSCSETKTGCWYDSDMSRLNVAMENFIKFEILGGNDNPFEQNLDKNIHPMKHMKNNFIAIGASSGGSMAAKAVIDGVVSSALVMVMGIQGQTEHKLMDKALSEKNRDKKIVASLYFAPMPKDANTLKRVKANHLSLKGFNNMPVVLDETTCTEFPVSAQYLYSRVPGMTINTAKSIVEALIGTKHMSQSGLLMQDPTKSKWRYILKAMSNPDIFETQKDFKVASLPYNNNGEEYLWGKHLLTAGKSPLAKALHRAWAFHEYCSEVVEPALDFFEQNQPD